MPLPAPTLLVGTGNAHKAREIAQLLAGVAVQISTPAELGLAEEPEETGTTFAENACLKARHYAQRSGLPCLADDSGLVVDALDGRPGVFSSRYAPTDPERIARLLDELRGLAAPARTARFVCAAALAIPGNGGMREIVETGVCEGRILESPRGDGGFGYDPVFFVESLGRSLAEAAAGEKNACSHRGRALRLMAPHLIALFQGKGA